MKKFLSLLLTGVMSAMLLAGCGTTANDPDPASSSTPPAGEEERSITIAQSANFSMGFAPGVQSYEATYYMNNFYEGLVEYRDGEYLPCLATDWAASDDGLTYTFHLRDDVQFNDGTAFNAEAVKLYFDNMKAVIGTSANYGQLDMLTTEITVDDEYTVSFHLSRPYYNVLNDLSMAMPRGILSAAAFNEDGSLNTEYLMTHTPGTGPYMFESVNETATEYTFVKNPNYWGEEPDVDRFTVKVIPESKVAAMRAGEVDFIMGSDTLDANSYLELSQVEGITGVISDFDFVTEFIALNDEVAPMDDLNVRTAIQMAIDKESIAQNIYSGLRAKADSVMPAAMPYCVATVSTPDYDMDGAIALLEGSGRLAWKYEGFSDLHIRARVGFPQNGGGKGVENTDMLRVQAVGFDLDFLHLRTAEGLLVCAAEFRLEDRIFPKLEGSGVANQLPTVQGNLKAIGSRRVAGRGDKGAGRAVRVLDVGSDIVLHLDIMPASKVHMRVNLDRHAAYPLPEIEVVRALIEQHTTALSAPGGAPFARIIIRLRAIPVGDDPTGAADRAKLA